MGQVKLEPVVHMSEIVDGGGATRNDGARRVWGDGRVAAWGCGEAEDTCQ